MKFNTVCVLLVGALFVCAVGTVWLSTSYILSVRQLHRIDAQAIDINAKLAAAQSLANQSIEYSRRNPAIDPLLQQFNLKPRPQATAPAQQPQPTQPAAPRPAR